MLTWFWHVSLTKAQIGAVWSLSSLFAWTISAVFHTNEICILDYSKCVQWRFWWNCANAQADLNLRWAQMSEDTCSVASNFILTTGSIVSWARQAFRRTSLGFSCPRNWNYRGRFTEIIIWGAPSKNLPGLTAKAQIRLRECCPLTELLDIIECFHGE